MDDNIHLEPCRANSGSTVPDIDYNTADGCKGSTEEVSWRPSHILDFSDLSIGDYLSLIQLVFPVLLYKDFFLMILACHGMKNIPLCESFCVKKPFSACWCV